MSSSSRPETVSVARSVWQHAHWKQPRRPALTDLARKVAGENLVARRQHNHALDQVPQLAHVAGPRITDEHLHRRRGDPMEGPIVER